MELITSDSFGKWMQVFQSVVNREVPQVRILLTRQCFHLKIHAPFDKVDINITDLLNF